MLGREARRVLACPRAPAVRLARRALESARAEDGADFEACASATAGDRLCALLLALERRHWQLHQPAPDAHSWLACSCRRARAPNAANCISRGCRLARRALESARAEDALERRQWQLHQLAPDSHRWLACSCRRRRLSASAAALRPGTTACRRPRGVLCCTTDPPTRSPALACCARRARRQAAIAPTPVQWRLRPSATSAFPYCACAPSRRPC